MPTNHTTFFSLSLFFSCFCRINLVGSRTKLSPHKIYGQTVYEFMYFNDEVELRLIGSRDIMQEIMCSHFFHDECLDLLSIIIN